MDWFEIDVSGRRCVFRGEDRSAENTRREPTASFGNTTDSMIYGCLMGYSGYSCFFFSMIFIYFYSDFMGYEWDISSGVIKHGLLGHSLGIAVWGHQRVSP